MIIYFFTEGSGKKETRKEINKDKRKQINKNDTQASAVRIILKLK
jgi:hypothetical protein